MKQPAWAQPHRDGVMLLVRVQPRASRAGIRGEMGGRLKVCINSPPADGRANRELVELVAKRLGVAKSSLSLERGEKSREKVLLCRGVGLEEAVKLLGGD